MFYNPKYLLLTATQYDHPEIFKTNDSYLEAFTALVKLLPDNGILFYDQDLVDEKVVNACNCLKIPFQTSKIVGIPDTIYKESAVRASVLCSKLNIDQKIIYDSIISFSGLKERNEFLGEFGGRYLFIDSSQQSSKIKNALSLIKERYPKNEIVVVFNPSETSLKYKENLDQYSKSFDLANKVIITKVDFLKEIEKQERVTGPELVSAFGGGQKIHYEPLDEKIFEKIKEETKAGDVVVFMTSGGLRFNELTKEIINGLSKL